MSFLALAGKTFLVFGVANRKSVAWHVGRVLDESLKGGAPVPFTSRTVRSAAAANGFATMLNAQDAGGAPYFDAAGAPGRTLGLRP